MADNTAIEWTDATWNPITGCSVVSPGCTNCYAMRMAGTRLRHHPTRAGLTVDSKAGPVWNGQVRLNADQLTQPLRWRRPRKIFVCAHGDLFHESVPDSWIDRVFAVMALSPQHTYQVLTKRSARMRAYMADPVLRSRVQSHCNTLGLEITGRASARDAEEAEEFVTLATGDWPLGNVWLGVSAEDQARADERIPDLLATPAAVRFLSAEPLLGAIDLGHYTFPVGVGLKPMSGRFGVVHDVPAQTRPALDWVIVGGESGPGARPMHPDWARQLRDACAAAGVPFFFKQWGAWAHARSHQDTPAIGKHLRWVRDDGRSEPSHADVDRIERREGHQNWKLMRNVGKKAAGRTLDGALHEAMPGGAG